MLKTIFATAAGAVALAACATVEVKPIKVQVEPIHVTVDVRIQKDLDNFFAFENEAKSAPATQPAGTGSAQS